MNIFTNSLIICDVPKSWGLYFQDTVSSQMEVLLHNNVMFYSVIVLLGAGWILVSTIKNPVSNRIRNKYLKHSSTLPSQGPVKVDSGIVSRLVLTIGPALVLILIGLPCLKLLYLIDNITDSTLIVFVEEHASYLSYEYSGLYSEDYTMEELFSEEQVEIGNGIDSNNDHNSSSSSSSDQENNAPGEGEGGSDEEADAPDPHPSIETCTHDSVSPMQSDAPRDLECDLNPTVHLDGDRTYHGAYVIDNTLEEPRVIGPVYCDHCFAIICRNCAS